jgi:pseudouridylate synthase
VPALIALDNGQILIGTSDAELERIACENKIAKISQRDIPAALLSKKLAATTVASTMFCAHLAGNSHICYGRDRRGASRRGKEL